MDDVAKRRNEDFEASLKAWKAKQNKNISSVIIDHASLKNNYKKPESQFITKFLMFLAFAIPIAILGYALYVNYLPFGYEKNYTLNFDDEGVISPLSNEIYLTNTQGRKLLSLKDGVEGQVNLVLEPKVVLKDATVGININAENVFIASPLDIDLDSINWDYNWDFASEVPKDFVGGATYNIEEACTHFNAYNEQKLSLPNSQDLFESGPMTIYVRWKPSLISESLGNNQQIIGHYNWEIWQSEDNLQFRVGRTNNNSGSFYIISSPINENFFNEEHEAIAIYSPSKDGNGYIEFWIDKNLVGRTLIGEDIIYRDYGDNDLSLGWSPHNYENNPYFDGCVYNARITKEIIKQENNELILENVEGVLSIPLIGNGAITSINLMVTQ